MIEVGGHMQIGNLVAALRGRLLRLTGKDLRADLRKKYEDRLGTLVVAENDGVRILKFDQKQPGAMETYREIQEIGNKHKLNVIFAVEANIAHMARYVEARVGTVAFALCHGTRSGAEQRWFKKHLKGSPRVLGTEISETASQFPDTIQWDFHEQNSEWIGKADIIYSNSWDHSIDPERMFRNWMECLTEKGVILIEHSIHHEGRNADPLDPFGATRDGLVRLLDRVGCADFKVVDVIVNLPRSVDGLSTIVVART